MPTMNIISISARTILWIVSFACAALPALSDDLKWLDAYNISWNIQSKDSSESMPCGGGDTGMNVWVENGDLMCYVQRSGCFDENNQFLKLGRIRVRLDPNPFAGDSTFRQKLKLRHGHVEISGKQGELDATIRVWADVFRPVVHVEIESNQALQATASYEGWRQNDVDLPDNAARPRFACLGWDGYPGKVTRFKDHVTFLGDTVSFHHRNRDDQLLFDYTLRQQGLEGVIEQLVNTQKGRTFGGILRGKDFVQAGTSDGKYVLTPFTAWNLRSKRPAKTHHLVLISHIAQTDTLEQWEDGLKPWLDRKTTLAEERAQSRAWWGEFWDRSHIVIHPNKADENFLSL